VGEILNGAFTREQWKDAKTWRYMTANPVAEVELPADAKALRSRAPFRSVDELRAAILAIPQYGDRWS